MWFKDKDTILQCAEIGLDAWGWAILCSARPTCFHRLWYCMCFCWQRNSTLKGLRLMSKSAQHRETLTLLSRHWDLTDDLYKRLESLTCQLYCAIGLLNVESINELRYDMFLAKKGEIVAASSMLFFTSKPLQKGKLSMCNLEEELESIHSSAKSCWHGMVHGPWWTDWGEGQSWNFCLVTAKRNVYRTVVLAYRTVCSAQICASWALRKSSSRTWR